MLKKFFINTLFGAAAAAAALAGGLTASATTVEDVMAEARKWGCHLDLCGSELFHFSCFPLKLDCCDGSPIRAVAWFD